MLYAMIFNNHIDTYSILTIMYNMVYIILNLYCSVIIFEIRISIFICYKRVDLYIKQLASRIGRLCIHIYSFKSFQNLNKLWTKNYKYPDSRLNEFCDLFVETRSVTFYKWISIRIHGICFWDYLFYCFVRSWSRTCQNYNE